MAAWSPGLRLFAFARAILAHPEQPSYALIDLVDDGQETVAVVPQHFVDADGANPVQVPVLQTPVHSHLS